MPITFYYSEADARTKWCPFSRIDNTASNRPNSGPNADTGAGWPPCVASACMAWRWVETHIHDPDNPKGDLIVSGDTHGYCGLAGDPISAAQPRRY